MEPRVFSLRATVGIVACQKKMWNGKTGEAKPKPKVGEVARECCVRRTRRGELSIAADRLTLLAKNLLPLSKKTSLEVQEKLVQPKLMLDRIPLEHQRRLVARAETVSAIRICMNSQWFHDVETWLLEPKRNMMPSLKVQLGAATMPGMVVLMAAGLSDRAYEMAIRARDSYSGCSIIVDMVRAYADWRDMMTVSEMLIGSVVQRLGEAGFSSEGAIELSSSFPKKSVLAAVQEETGVGFLEIETDDEARRRASSLGCEIVGHETWGAVPHFCFP